MSLHKVFVKIKTLFTIRIIGRWTSIPELHFIHRRQPPNFVWIRKLLQKLLFLQPGIHVRTDIHTDRQTDRRIFFLQSCDYNTFSFEILRIRDKKVKTVRGQQKGAFLSFLSFGHFFLGFFFRSHIFLIPNKPVKTNNF